MVLTAAGLFAGEDHRDLDKFHEKTAIEGP